jgi:hypothetical protein
LDGTQIRSTTITLYDFAHVVEIRRACAVDCSHRSFANRRKFQTLGPAFSEFQLVAHPLLNGLKSDLAETNRGFLAAKVVVGHAMFCHEIVTMMLITLACQHLLFAGRILEWRLPN